MNFWERRILPRIVDRAMRGEDLGRERATAIGAASGRVVELGFGSGLNLAHYSDAVSEVLAIEPNLVAQGLAAPRIERAPFPVRFVGLEGMSLPLEDASVDSVVTTWTLCTIPDPLRALRESLRVLLPGGRLYFIEHGKSAEPGVERWQRRLNPLQRRVFGGCHLDRPIDELVSASGFTLEALERYYGKGPRVLTALYRGVAVRGADA